MSMIHHIEKKQIKNMIENSQDYQICDDSLNELLAQWQANKKDIYDLFGGQLMISEKVKSLVILEEYYRLKRQLKLQLNHIFADNTDDLEFCKIMVLIDSLSLDEVTNNKIYRDKYYIDDETIIAKKDFKVSKAIRLLLSDQDNFAQLNDKSKTKRDIFDIEYSKFQSACYCKGELVISIHPLDYLTMSENTAGWQSCHRLQGEYRSGVLSLLSDSTTIVSYLKQSSDCNIYGVDWNSKKWRQLIFVDIQRFSAIYSRQYPNENEAIAEESRKLLNHAMIKYCKANVHPNIGDNWIKSNKFDRVSFTEKSDLFFNDLSNIEYRTYTFLKDIGNAPNVTIGDHVLCLNCSDDLDLADSFFCSNCSSIGICDDCECNIGEGNDYYTIQDRLICDNCRRNNYMFCEYCEQIVENDEINFADRYEMYACDNCIEHHFYTCDECSELILSCDTIEIQDEIYCQDCAEQIAGTCDECNDHFHDRNLNEHDGSGYFYCDDCLNTIKEKECQLSLSALEEN